MCKVFLGDVRIGLFRLISKGVVVVMLVCVRMIYLMLLWVIVFLIVLVM